MGGHTLLGSLSQDYSILHSQQSYNIMHIMLSQNNITIVAEVNRPSIYNVQIKDLSSKYISMYLMFYLE